MANLQNILVIKLSALGDFVQAMGPCAAIRRAHSAAHITLLTTSPYIEFARSSGYFDKIWIDQRPRWWQVRTWLTLKQRLDGGGFDRVYDLQTSDRSAFYFRLLRRPKPDWSGIAAGCSLPHANPQREVMHTIDRQREQLAIAGIDGVPLPTFDWICNDTDAFGLPETFILFVPGGSAGRPGKRWSINGYVELAARLSVKNYVPVLIGAADEIARNAEIAQNCPLAIDLTGQTSITDLVQLARGASGAVGNDSGPMHLIAAAACPSLVLYSHESDPALCAQRGPRVEILRRNTLDMLTTDEVEAAMRLR
jgi:ADP-heptose:LPS heptosyltransferase